MEAVTPSTDGSGRIEQFLIVKFDGLIFNMAVYVVESNSDISDQKKWLVFLSCEGIDFN